MKITIAGCGNMGMIYARAFLKYNILSPSDLLLVEKNEQRRDSLRTLQAGIVTLASDPRIGQSDILILAVKPQDFDELSTDLRIVLNRNTIIISIMAGIPMAYITAQTGHQKIIRAMPNAPAEFGMGLTGYTCSPQLSIPEIHKAENLLTATGRTLFFEEEDMLNAVTALSGSGPAYFYYFVKHMIAAGMKMGMSENVASTLVKQTMLGSFHLLNNNDKSADELIRAVASKGGTTEAALEVFEKEGAGSIIEKGILQAMLRAAELAKR